LWGSLVETGPAGERSGVPGLSKRDGMQEGNGGTNRPIRVLLADDHTLFRQGLAGLLASYGDLEIIAEVPNDQEALRLAQEENPDVVIMQVQMPFERSKESLLKMGQISPPPKVVVVTMFEQPHYVRELMNLGASAYLLKSVSVEHLTGAVRAAVFDPKGQHVVVGMPREMLKEVEDGSGGVLSVREMEILLLVARGLSNHQIASALTVSEATVKRHLANAYPKMGVASRGGAVRKALFENWITIEDITHEQEEEQQE
jgi:DNA-binding NarL/FixJ family response regulator